MSSNTILVTGATSGFGAAIAELFLQLGWKVIATGRRADRLQALVEHYPSSQLHAAAFDIRDTEQIKQFVEHIPAEFADIDVLVNNAGLALGIGPAQQSSLAQWQQMVDTNISALIHLTHQLLSTLIRRKGLIINVSSIAASYAYTGSNVYGATKAFVTQFSLGLRSDLHGTGVRVTSLEPGLAQTEFTLVRTSGNQQTSDMLYENASPITANDIANTVAWLTQLPPHLNINRLEVMPVSQSFAGMQIHRQLPD